ncbi:MAG: hypothetical protein IKS12_05670 [Eubacterium sp.]|nr:hypothetical protein [Eubacterium sp.]
MTDFLKKQRAFRRLRNISIIVSAVMIFMYIGAEPYIEKGFGNTAPFQLALFVLVIISMALLFIYESRFAKAAEFIQDIGYEISDSGYYLTTREEKDAAEFTKAAVNDLKADGYRCESAISVNGLEFAAVAVKGNEFIYFVSVDTADKNDIIAYTDSALYDLMQNKLKSKGNCAVVFLCSNADDSAVRLSKSVSRTFSGKKVLKVGYAVAELPTGKIYFRGNEPSVIQKLVARYVLKCDLPIESRLASGDKLPYQSELKNKLKSFDINEFKNGKYDER